MRDPIGDEESTVFRGVLLTIAEPEDGMLKTWIDLVGEWVAFEKVVAPANVEGQFGNVADGVRRGDCK